MEPPSVLSPFAQPRGLPQLERRYPSPRRALPSLLRSYELMCQCHLPLLSFGLWPMARSLCRLLAAPAASGSSRRYLCESFSGCRALYSGGTQGAFTCFFPWVIGLPQVLNGSAFRMIPLKRLHSGQTFRSCRHSLMFRPPGLLALQVVPTSALYAHGGQGFYFRAEHASLPQHASDTLAVRTRQLTARGLPPRKIRSLVGCSQYPARLYPCLRFKLHLTMKPAKLGAECVRYSFLVGLFHSLLHAGLSRRSHAV